MKRLISSSTVGDANDLFQLTKVMESWYSHRERLLLLSFMDEHQITYSVRGINTLLDRL